MRFLIDGSEYRIHFSHLRDLPPVKGAKRRREKMLIAHPTVGGVTLCVIVVTLKPLAPARVLVAQGMAFCASSDAYNKETGRVKALGRAIQQARPLWAVEKKLLAAYHNRRTEDLDMKRTTAQGGL